MRIKNYQLQNKLQFARHAVLSAPINKQMSLGSLPSHSLTYMDFWYSSIIDFIYFLLSLPPYPSFPLPFRSFATSCLIK
jgi:hypothetical protein